MFKFLDGCSIAIQIENQRRQRPFFTNQDVVKGLVIIKSKQKVKVKCLTVILNVTASTILLDSKGCFMTCENRNIYSKSIPIVVNNIFNNGIHAILFKFELPGTTETESSFNLPPVLKYVGANSSTKIDYSIDALLERPNSKQPMCASHLFNFLPSPQFTSFSLNHNPSMPPSAVEHSFSFKYNSVFDGTLNTKLMQSNKKMLSIRRFSNRVTRAHSTPALRSCNPFVDFECPFTLSVDFSHAKMKNKKFSKGVISAPQSLAESVSLFLISIYSAQDLYSMLYKKEYNENCVYPEVLKLASLKMSLVSLTTFCCGKSILEGEDEQCLVDKSNLNFSINLADFKKIKYKNSAYYKYELDPAVYDCMVKTEGLSFISSSVKRDYQLQIDAEFVSTTSKNRDSVRLNTDILVLNNILDELDDVN